MAKNGSVPAGLLDSLIAELNDENTVALALAGSYARGDASEYSDLDIIKFVKELPHQESDRYLLEFRDGILVSISLTTIEIKREGLRRPEEIVWSIPPLKEGRILLDKDGSLAQLQQEAANLQWESLQPQADHYASFTMAGNAEEIFKILGALEVGDDAPVLYGIWGLTDGMGRAIAVQRGVIIGTGNSYLQQVQEIAGTDTLWTRYYRLAVGFEVGCPEIPPYRIRGIAALHLYIETEKLLRHIMEPGHTEVVAKTIAAIEASGFDLPEEMVAGQVSWLMK